MGNVEVNTCDKEASDSSYKEETINGKNTPENCDINQCFLLFFLRLYPVIYKNLSKEKGWSAVSCQEMTNITNTDVFSFLLHHKSFIFILNNFLTMFWNWKQLIWGFLFFYCSISAVKSYWLKEKKHYSLFYILRSLCQLSVNRKKCKSKIFVLVFVLANSPL